MTRSHMDEPLDMEMAAMYLPNITLAHDVSADMWSGIAHQPYGSQHQTSNFAPAYQAPYGTFQTPAYTTPQEVTSPILTTPYPGPSFTPTALPTPAFSNSSGPPMLPVENQQTGIRMSSWVGVYGVRNQQALALETGVFKK